MLKALSIRLLAPAGVCFSQHGSLPKPKPNSVYHKMSSFKVPEWLNFSTAYQSINEADVSSITFLLLAAEISVTAWVHLLESSPAARERNKWG